MRKSNSISWTKKDLLDLENLTREEIELILQTAASFKEVSTREVKKVPALRGKTVVNLFYEPSTRTRISFEVAAKRLSADVINIATETSSVRKGETLIDTGKNIEALKVDIIIMRHNYSGAAVMLARHLKASVVNAGDGWHEHPTQALLDMFTLREKLGRIEGLRVRIFGGLHGLGRALLFARQKFSSRPQLNKWACALRMILKRPLQERMQ